MHGFTPLDIAMGVSKVRTNAQKIFKHSKGAVAQMKHSENLAMANVIFSKISEYSFMHSSHQITEAIIEAIKESLPAIDAFLESRIIKADQFSTQTQRAISDSVLRTSAAYGEYGSLRVPIRAREKQIVNSMFEKEGSMRAM